MGGTMGLDSGVTPNRVQGLFASKLLASRSLGDGSFSLSKMEGQSKGDRVAEILSRVRTLTKRLDNKTSVNTSINATSSRENTENKEGKESKKSGGAKSGESDSSSSGLGGNMTDITSDKTNSTGSITSSSGSKGVSKKHDISEDISSKATAISALEMSNEFSPVTCLAIGVTEGKDSSRPVSRSHKGEREGGGRGGGGSGGGGGDVKGDQSPALRSRVSRNKNNRAHRYENSDVIGEEDDAELLGDDDAKVDEEEEEEEGHKSDGALLKKDRDKGRREMSGSSKERDEEDDIGGSSENDRLLDR